MEECKYYKKQFLSKYCELFESSCYGKHCNVYKEFIKINELEKQNIKLRKALKDCISENCYYHEDECNMCTIGLLGQCKIPEAAKLLEECRLPYIQLKGRCER